MTSASPPSPPRSVLKYHVPAAAHRASESSDLTSCDVRPVRVQDAGFESSPAQHVLARNSVYQHAPRFAIDRALGKTAPGILRHHGWDIVLIQDIFPDDAQRVSDTDWIKWASSHVDGALTKDAAIRRQASYREARIPIFCLGNQKLGFEAMAALFLQHERKIWQVASQHAGRAFWQIYANGDIRRLDP